MQLANLVISQMFGNLMIGLTEKNQVKNHTMIQSHIGQLASPTH